MGRNRLLKVKLGYAILKQKLGGFEKYNPTFHNLKKNNTLGMILFLTP